MPHDLAIVIVSTSEACWLRTCLPSVFARAGGLTLDVIVADNSAEGTAEFVAREFPQARVVRCDNHGFSHANNRALMTCDARYVLFLNPDTVILHGYLREFVARMDALPDVGLAGCRQVSPEGSLWPSMRRFPNAVRQLGEALGSERQPFRASWLGERELDMSKYDGEFDGDWTSGSFMLVRREAIESAGFLDERFFLYSEEIDFALRITQAGWRVRHLPQMEIVHHAGKKGWNPRAEAQYTLARKLYAAKHFSPLHRLAFLLAVAVRYLVRLAAFRVTREPPAEGVASLRRALRVLAGLEGPPYEPQPPCAVRPRQTLGSRR